MSQTNKSPQYTTVERDSLFSELAEMSSACKAQGEERKVYLHEDNLGRVQEIGQRLYEIGGVGLMGALEKILCDGHFYEDGTDLKLAWEGIGGMNGPGKSLFDELAAMSSACTAQGSERDVFLHKDNLDRVREIGQRLYEIGGINLMREVDEKLRSPRYNRDGIELGYAWDGVGEMKA
jgi:hypothetical protein